MIIRIVKMVFKEEVVDLFKRQMEDNSKRIRAFEGCEYLQILQAEDDPCVVFTYSYWKDDAALEKYRNSELFNELWPAAREKFAERAQAWTVDRIIERP